jgi:hypothetical protein
MSQYIITYLGGDQPSTLDEGKQCFVKYQEWLGSLGDNIVTAMQPYKNTQVINPERHVSKESPAGIPAHSIVTAESIQAAVDIAGGCTLLDINGSLEVSKLVKTR